MEASLAFYTKVLDFECVDGNGDTGDPSFSVLMRKGRRSFSQATAETARLDKPSLF